MTSCPLNPTAFRGDRDLDELHAFFQSAHQFAGDTLWTVGTSLKAAYVNTFEFMNHAPVVQMWRDDDQTVQAVSHLSLGPAEWAHQAAPRYRDPETTTALVEQADAAFALLTDHAAWHTARYESMSADIELLGQLGYVRDDVTEVFMTRSLDDPIDAVACPDGVEVGLLDQDDPDQVHRRAMAQVDAFTGGSPTAAEIAWIGRSLPHLFSYGRPDVFPSIAATDPNGAVLSLADVFLDATNQIGEFEPVATRAGAQRRGLSKVVTTRGLCEMRDAGMTQAVVRTGADNNAAIAAYESVGFETVDVLVRFRRVRQARLGERPAIHP